MRRLSPVAVIVLAGCLAPAAQVALESAPAEAALVAVCLPGFHDAKAAHASLATLAARHPDVARLEILGTSHEGRPIPAIVLAARDAVETPPLAVLLDGQHHGDEDHAGESLLNLAWFLAENKANATVARWLRSVEVWIVPHVNPDGHEAGTRDNARGVDLNRNYDADWGNPLGTQGANVGETPFSEPESRAIRDLTYRLHDRLAAYVTVHISRHSVAVPWAAFDPPFEIPADHETVFQSILAWTRANTEYDAGRAGYGRGDANLPYAASGTSVDWAYAAHGVPSFLLETYNRTAGGLLASAAPRVAPAADDEDYWAHASLPLYLMVLESAAELRAWSPQLRDPALPAGVPPEPAVRGTPAVCADKLAVVDVEDGLADRPWPAARGFKAETELGTPWTS